ncbi:MAG: hypothetical protein MJA29_11015, partial [Candidatus Omnitrophica bacterium]|nr:hypothetical protein [Candidatus Omnitrophota bacterium]
MVRDHRILNLVPKFLQPEDNEFSRLPIPLEMMDLQKISDTIQWPDANADENQVKKLREAFESFKIDMQGHLKDLKEELQPIQNVHEEVIKHLQEQEERLKETIQTAAAPVPPPLPSLPPLGYRGGSRNFRQFNRSYPKTKWTKEKKEAYSRFMTYQAKLENGRTWASHVANVFQAPVNSLNKFREWILNENLWLVMRKFLNQVAQINLKNIQKHRERGAWPLSQATWDDSTERNVQHTSDSLIWVMHGMFAENGIIHKTGGPEFRDFRIAMRHHLMTTAITPLMMCEFIQTMLYANQCRIPSKDRPPFTIAIQPRPVTTEHQYRRLLTIGCLLNIMDIFWRRFADASKSLMAEYFPFLNDHQQYGLMEHCRRIRNQECECYNHSMLPLKGASVWLRKPLPTYYEYLKEYSESELESRYQNSAAVDQEYEQFIMEGLYARLFGYAGPDDPKTWQQAIQQVDICKGEFTEKQTTHLRHLIRSRCKAHLFWDGTAEEATLSYLTRLRAVRSELQYFNVRRTIGINLYLERMLKNKGKRDNVFLSLIQLIAEENKDATRVYLDPKTLMTRWASKWKCGYRGVSPNDLVTLQMRLDNELKEAKEQGLLDTDNLDPKVSLEISGEDLLNSIQEILGAQNPCKVCDNIHQYSTGKLYAIYASDDSDDDEFFTASDDEENSVDTKPEDKKTTKLCVEAKLALLQEEQVVEPPPNSPQESVADSGVDATSQPNDPEDQGCKSMDQDETEGATGGEETTTTTTSHEPEVYGSVNVDYNDRFIPLMKITGNFVNTMSEFQFMEQQLQSTGDLKLQAPQKTWNINKGLRRTFHDRIQSWEPTQHITYIVEFATDKASELEEKMNIADFVKGEKIPNFSTMTNAQLKQYCTARDIHFITSFISWTTQQEPDGPLGVVYCLSKEIYVSPDAVRRSLYHNGVTFETDKNIPVHVFGISNEDEKVRDIMRSC